MVENRKYFNLFCHAMLLLAAMAHHVTRGKRFYQTFLIWPYAVAPVIAAVLWGFLFNPSIGLVTFALARFGVVWNHALNPGQAMALVVIASVWQQISYNFLFFYAGLQSIPQSLFEAAAIDGAGPVRRFFGIAFPLLSPTSFFLLPAGEALWQSTKNQDAFGTSSEFVGLGNFRQLLADPLYL